MRSGMHICAQQGSYFPSASMLRCTTAESYNSSLCSLRASQEVGAFVNLLILRRKRRHWEMKELSYKPHS